MNPRPWACDVIPDADFEILWRDGERLFCRTTRADQGEQPHAALVVFLATEQPTPSSLEHLVHEYELRDVLDDEWAVRPLALVRERGRTMLVFDAVQGEPLEHVVGRPMELGRFLRLAISLSAALCRLHERGLVHKDIKPANILVDSVSGRVRLMGFGIASRTPQEYPEPEAPEFIEGTLPYIAPEQTGKMSRSIDSRSDLYSLGVAFYQLLTGRLPFTASDPTGWVHCHIAQQPLAPADRSASIPGTVSAIVMKLLAKTAEERYQTAFGVERDLRRCLGEWELSGRIGDFEPGLDDKPDRLLISKKLYGRAEEIRALRNCFDGVSAGGGPVLVLVSGYSGVGKSSLVNELEKWLVPPRGLFAAGKFDQYKRDIPYATLAQALRKLIQPLLSKGASELGDWREKICTALEPNGSLLTNLVPDLTLIIGEQPAVSDLPARDAQARFHLVVRRFIRVFACAEHPLALFFDDLQWLDAATLDLLEDLSTQRDLKHLLIIGAYRDNDVDFCLQFMHKLAAMREEGATIEELALKPLRYEDLLRLVGESLHCAPDDVAPLAQLVQQKTAGNPFFAIQLVCSLAEEGVLSFDHVCGKWVWDMGRVRAKNYTDNVADLMVDKLRRLPARTLEAMQALACLGSGTELAVLSLVCRASTRQMHNDLRAAVRAGLLLRAVGSYHFLHDRVQEAAYALIPVESREKTHLDIGRLLAIHTPDEKYDERIFDIANQLNRGSALISLPIERGQLAELNLRAGKRAKAAAAYLSAIHYFDAGAALLGGDSRARRQQIIFQLELERAECEFVIGQSAAAEKRLSMLAVEASDAVELAAVTCLRIDLYTALDKVPSAIEAGLAYLRTRDINWVSHPGQADARREYEQIESTLGIRAVESLGDMPLVGDQETMATLNVLIKMIPPAMFDDANLGCLAICRAVNLSLQQGNSDASCFAYAYLGMVAGPHFGNYQAGLAFGKLGYDLVEAHGLKRFQVRTLMIFGSHVMPWTKHVSACRDLISRSFQAANKNGDLCFAAFSCNNLCTNLLTAGAPLREVQREAEHGMTFARKARFGLVCDIHAGQLGLVRSLRGRTSVFGSFDDNEFDELEFERHLASSSSLALPECFYWVRKMQARFFAGENGQALDASTKALQLLWAVPSNLESVEYHFFSALAHAANCDSICATERLPHIEAIAAHHAQLEVWAGNCPANFAHRSALVAAEYARLQARELDAMRLYEAAIRSARENDFVHDVALANELAARFYMSLGFENAAVGYWRDARYGYLRWGADAKVRQLDDCHPDIGVTLRSTSSTDTIVSSVEHLDLDTVIRVSHAVSREIVLDKLIDTIMRTAIEHAGARKGLLILKSRDELRIEAKAAIREGEVVIDVRAEPLDPLALPVSIAYFVARARESIVLHDTSMQNAFSTDIYFGHHRTRSVLCVPLVKQAEVVGLLYLENDLALHAFTPTNVEVLKLLASQAAISLENSRLYGELRAGEFRIRRLVEANIIGIAIWKIDGEILETNDAFARIIGGNRQDLASRHVSLTALTPPEWQAVDDRSQEELSTTGVCEPFEKEIFRIDGSRVPVLVGAASLEGGQGECVAFVLDLSERRRTEASLRETERQYHEARVELMRTNRLMTMGQLVASITHEIRQPITGTIASAAAGQNWLAHQPPKVKEALEAFKRISRDGLRASEVINRIRALVNKEPALRNRLDVNEVIFEVVTLTSGEASRQHVALQTRLATDLKEVLADRIQLQQVILNLIINAIEAMSVVDDRERVLSITTRRGESGDVLVEVRDTGPGLSADCLDHIFEDFYTTKSSGMGMGLSICRSIVEAHGGSVWATANAPHGAAFLFSLPLCIEDAPTQAV